MIHKPSQNYNERESDVSMIIIHYTGMMSRDDAIERLCDPEPPKKLGGPVSAHYLIDEDGTLYWMVDEDMRAWHAGESYWDGLTDINSASIGIELVNPGHDYGYSRFPIKQMHALIELCKDLKTRHPIRRDLVLGHSDIAPDRKKDPGEHFNWQMLAKEGFGLWPNDVNARDRQLASVYLSSEQRMRDAFTILGYDPEVKIHQVITAFNRHYSRSEEEELSSHAAAKLACLVRTKREILNTRP